MTIKEKIRETKNNGVLIEIPLIGDGSEDNPHRPRIFDEGDFYTHLDENEIDYKNRKAKVWINKKRTPDKDVEDLRKNIDDSSKPHKKIEETEGGKEIAERR